MAWPWKLPEFEVTQSPSRAKGIVVDRIYLDLERRDGVADRVARGADDLRNAAQAERVAKPPRPRRSDPGGAGGKPLQGGARLELAAMRLGHGDPPVET